ncbi:MAG TPA: Hsp70 family protein [Spirochaetales bacterium]|nr:Hsp70 family protein [Spirochaetales bacterium]
MGPVIGIDFGTTNSLCAWLDGDRPAIIPNARGDRSTPSVAASTAKGEILVGESAKNQALVNPDNTVAGVKRLLASGGLLSMGGKTWRPEEIAALILSSLKADAERHLGREVSQAVVAAPANFSERERRALLEAGRLAGLEVLRILNEPTAAALARAWAAGSGSAGSAPRGVAAPSKAAPGGPARSSSAGQAGKAAAGAATESPGPQTILVYDFGGGTFDVTVLRQDGPDCVVLSSRGDGRLGGADLDRELYRRAAEAFAAEYGLEVGADRRIAQALSEQAEKAKIELSERLEASMAIPFALATGADGQPRVVHPVFAVSREEFEAVALPYVERSLALAERALKDAGLGAKDVDLLVLSGGSSRIPLVRRLLKERLGLEPAGGVDPEESVALGAAVQASLLEGSERLRLRDVVSRTYGVEIDGGRFVPLIRKNSPVPASRSRVFTTVSEGQDSVEIHVLQGDAERAGDNLSLGRFLLSGLRFAKAGVPRIKVDFGIDESDILHVEAVDLDTGAAQAISIADLDRGAGAEPPEALAEKARLLAGRLAELKDGLSLESGLEAELEEAALRAEGARRDAPEGELRLLKAELEGLVGELLARRGELARR